MKEKMNLKSNIFPIGLNRHWKYCSLDGDCLKCDKYIVWIHGWQKKNLNSDKVINRTIADIKGMIEI